ncbi:MAG TPA: prenyltransferase/squalene oxidase repeat-containing protein, partial [Kofleriaceae bacterium]|nr:prenyltransferase/squalene oxidase repeat-containing protein [Kofleriaceae bacterium]
MPTALRPATRQAIARGRAHLLERQSPDGAWRAVNQGGVPYTALVLVVERFLGRLSDADAARGCRFLVAQQRRDGGWAASVGIDDSDVDASVMACAALTAAGTGAGEPPGVAALDSGKRYLRDQNAAARARMESRLVAAMAGLWSAADRAPTLAHRLVPGFDWAASRVVVGHALIGFTLFPLAARAIAARLPLEPRSWFERLELAAAD